MRTAARPFLLCAALILLAPWLASCAQPTVAKTETQEYMFWPPAPDAPRIQYLTSINSSSDITRKSTSMEEFLYGRSTVTDLPFERPYGIRMKDGKIYVCDATSANVSILDFRLREVRVLGQSGQVRLSKPIDIAVAPDGVKYIADTGHAAIRVYDADDKYVGQVAVKDMRPVSVAVRNDELYVSDLGASRVRVFDRFDGKELRTIGAPGAEKGQLGGAMGMALDAAGNVYVNDVLGCRVQKFAPDGAFVWGVGGLGTHPGQFVRPKLMTVDSDGIVYVVDFAFQNVQMFTDKGQMLMFFGGDGTFPGAMDAPTGVCTCDTDLDLFAQYIHPAFNARRLVIVTNNTGAHKINIYALGELKPGKTVADISPGRVKGIFGFATNTNMPSEGGVDINLGTQPSTQPAATQPESQPAPLPMPATAPATGPPAVTPRHPRRKRRAMIGQTTSSRRRAAGIPRRLAGMLLMLLGIVMAAGLIGCGTPRERYKTLSFFFDGVPDPDAPAKRGSGGDVQQTVFVGKRIVSQHKPFLDNRCAECHNSATGDIQDFSAAYSACIKCHKKVPTERDLMHGPVARAQCKWCHAPHESTEPALLKDTPIKVCTQCHDKQLLGSNPPEHVDGKTSCLQCHFGHGGTARYFLKPTTLPTGAPDGNTPASADATQPATPATAPAGPPATPAKELSP